MNPSKQYRSATTTTEMLPEELIETILLLLPVKSLYRFKSVSKSWFSRISNPNFVDSHLNRQTAYKNLILQFEHRTTILILDGISLQPIGPDLIFPYSAGELLPCLLNYEIVGCARGIVCVRAFRYKIDGFGSLFNSIYFWNPATNEQSKCINIPCETDEGMLVDYYGFGYDRVDNDFKVVRIVHQPGIIAPRAKVYSTNNDVWRNVELPFDIFQLGDTELRLCKLNDVECLPGGGGEMENVWTVMPSIDVNVPVQCAQCCYCKGDILLIKGCWKAKRDDFFELLRGCENLGDRMVPELYYWGLIISYTESLVSVPGSRKAKLRSREDKNYERAGSTDDVI